MKPDQKIKDIRAWLKAKGVLDLEPVTLFAEQLEKVSLDSRLLCHNAHGPAH